MPQRRGPEDARSSIRIVERVLLARETKEASAAELAGHYARDGGDLVRVPANPLPYLWHRLTYTRRSFTSFDFRGAACRAPN